MLKGFKQFILRGNVIDLAIGVVIGASFNTVVSSFVKDILTPLFSVIIRNPDFSRLSFNIGNSRILYGDFLNNLIAFVLVAAAAYFLVVVPMNSLVNRLNTEKPLSPTKKKCPFCFSEISIEATKCAHCTADLKSA